MIFDLDGTLVETEQVWAEVRREFALAHGGRWRDDAQATMMGMSSKGWASYLHDELGVAMSPDEIEEYVVDAMTERFAQSVPKLPGADDALAALQRDYPLAIATSAPLRVARAAIARAGWNAVFPVVVSADQVARGKPWPDVYLRALDELRGDAAKSAAVEDSTNGIRSAYAAGLRVVAIPNREFTPAHDALALAALILPSLEGLDPAAIRTLLERRE